MLSCWGQYGVPDMLRNVRDARAYIGMMLYVVSLTSLFKIVGEREGETL